VRRLWIVVVTSTVAACGGSAPSPPVVTPPTTNETVTGSERIGWDQPAADAVELATIGYAIYADGQRSDAAGVTCAAAPAASGFACSARLPALTPGAHTLQIASFVNDGGLLESARSAALQVTVLATDSGGALPPTRGGRPGVNSRTADRSAGRPIEVVATDIVDATDLAFAGDGQLLIAERAGTVRTIDLGRSSSSARTVHVEKLPLRSGAELLALTSDPQWPRTHFVFAIYADGDADNRAFTLTRFRDVDGTLGESAVLLDRIPAAAAPHAALRFGADATLYAAFDAGGDASRSDDLGSLNGKVLRLNTDGTTPKDQPSRTPLVAAGLFAPAALASAADAQDMWVIDRRGDGSAQLRDVAGKQPAFGLPQAFAPSSAALMTNERESGGRIGSGLVIGSADAGVLLRVVFDAAGTRPVSLERLPLNGVDTVRALAAGPDGALYVATATSVSRVPRP
jgi:glucose/arabinose dehydrogenase